MQWGLRTSHWQQFVLPLGDFLTRQVGVSIRYREHAQPLARGGYTGPSLGAHAHIINSLQARWPHTELLSGLRGRAVHFAKACETTYRV